ncbi:MAG: methyltransferase type 11 [Planctomycetes bacterium B3_Pla]|nr:MAG: methyltransferase type 11 [Planctomycetes bacterium B3_Pla]
MNSDVLQSDHSYDSVKEYYGKVVQKTSDLKTEACCSTQKIPHHLAEVLPLINAEIKDKYYGCGSPIPMCLENLKVLDLGCGTGRDCYVMSKLVGERGFVHGIDMTENQISVAKKHVEAQAKVFGYSVPNVKFIFDYIENIPEYFERESLDVVTSNCVINLTEDKEAILRSVYQILKFGGEMYFSDVYTDRRVPKEMSEDPVLRGECLGGALYQRDFERIAGKVGFSDPRIVSKRTIDVSNKEIQNLVGNIKFYSITYRLWKLEDLEDGCEDYGHIAVYNGQIPGSPLRFELDAGHVFDKNKSENVCGNTAIMLCQTRFKKHFEVSGSFKEHLGKFEAHTNIERHSQSELGNPPCC